MKPKILIGARALAKKMLRADKMGIKDLVAAGICTAEEFTEAFADHDVFQRELTQHLFSEASDAVFAATAGMSPGLEQITAAFTAYLDHNLLHPEMQQMTHAIELKTEGQDLLHRMELGVAMVAQTDLKSMAAHHIPERARLLTAMAVCVVRAEYKAQHKLPAMRAALFDFCRLSATPHVRPI